MLDSSSASPPAKKVKLAEEESVETQVEHGDDSENQCSICLQAMEDRTVVPSCSHEFCFDCLMIWTAQSRRCPLCAQNIGDYLIHDIRSRFDYRKHHLTPLRSNSPPPLLPRQTTAAIELRNAAQRRRRDRERRRRHEELDERDKLELSIAFRRWIYKHHLYAKHVASNSFTKYRPYPNPAQLAASPDLISRTTTFLRRELQVWQGLDVEFLTNLIISLMKAIDIRSESAVKLLAEFLDMDTPSNSGNRRVNAEHFAHEVYSYVRSPFRDLFIYDSVVQYDCPRSVSPPPQARRQNVRWQVEFPESHDPNHHTSYAPTPSSHQSEYHVFSPKEPDRGTNGYHSNRSPSPNAGHAVQRKIDEHTLRTPKDRSTRGSDSRGKGDGSKHNPASDPSGKGKGKENDHSGHDLDTNGCINDISMPAETSTFGPPNLLKPSPLYSKLFKEKQKELSEQGSPLPGAEEATCASPAVGPSDAEKDVCVRKTRPRSLLESIRTHLKPAAATSRLLKKEEDISLLHTDSKGSHDSSTPQHICPSSLIPGVIHEKHGRGDPTEKHRLEGNHSGDSIVGQVPVINSSDSSDVYFVKNNATPGNCCSLSSTSSGLRSVGRETPPLAQRRPSLLNDSIQGESELIPDEPQVSTTSAQQVIMLETGPLLQAQTWFLEHGDKYYVEDNQARQIDNPHVASSPRPAFPMTVPKHNNGPPNPDLIMTHQSDGQLLLSKLQSRLDNEKGIREAMDSHQPREGVKEVEKRQRPSHDSPNVENMVSTSATEGSPSRTGVRRSILDCRGIDGDRMEYKDVFLNPGLDTTALEASLKKRMRLRVKLAAEKQAAESR